MSLAFCVFHLSNTGSMLGMYSSISVRFLQEADLVRSHDAAAEGERHSSLELFGISLLALVLLKVLQ